MNTDKTNEPHMVKLHVNELTEALETNPPQRNDEQRWEQVRDMIYTTAFSVFGKKQSKTHDWFDTSAKELTSLMEDMRTALLTRKKQLTKATLKTLRAPRSKVQRAVRSCINRYWSNLCHKIQQAADIGNIRGV